jgi:cobalamin-dependent methionine synthase I
MIIVGERCNILNPAVFRAVAERDERAMLSVVEQQIEAGADALEVNLGVCRRASENWLPWAISVIRSVTEVPMFITAPAEALAPGLKEAGEGTWINGATADEARLESMLAAAECFGAGVVIMLVREGFLPTCLEEMVVMAEEVLELAERRGFPLDRIMIDPILRPRGDMAASLLARSMPDITLFMDVLRIISQLRQEKVRTVVGLSNISLGLSGQSRSRLHCQVLSMLAIAGLDAAIVNTKDGELMALARKLDRQEMPNAWQNRFSPASIGI